MPNVTIISLLNLISAVVALLISYYAYKNNRLVGSILLRYISAGFLLLGIGLLLQAGSEGWVSLTPLDAVRMRGLEPLGFIFYTALQVLAYGVFAWGYGLSAFARKQSPANAPVPATVASTAVKLLGAAAFTLAIYVGSQLAIIFLLLVIVAHGVRVFTHSQSNLALMVLFGFALIFGGHLLMLGGVLGSQSAIFLVGNSIEFCGFLGLLVFLVWSGRVVK